MSGAFGLGKLPELDATKSVTSQPSKPKATKKTTKVTKQVKPKRNSAPHSLESDPLTTVPPLSLTFVPDDSVTMIINYKD